MVAGGSLPPSHRPPVPQSPSQDQQAISGRANSSRDVLPQRHGEVTFPDMGNESASIIESDDRKIKENKLHSHVSLHHFLRF
jgi:hypothetical protein